MKMIVTFKSTSKKDIDCIIESPAVLCISNKGAQILNELMSSFTKKSNNKKQSGSKITRGVLIDE